MPVRRLALILLLPAALACARADAADGLDRIEHIVVIYAENRSFDHLFGLFPGADGIANATPEQKTQLDYDGTPLPHLPPVYQHGHADPAFPARMPNGPFRIDAPPVGRGYDEVLPSPIHNFYQNFEQINGGRNNRFVAATNVGAWAMGYFDGSRLRLWQWAREYTLADKFFMAAYGGSFLNHQWLVCACTPRDEAASAGARARPAADGTLLRRPASPASALDGPPALFDGTVPGRPRAGHPGRQRGGRPGPVGAQRPERPDRVPTAPDLIPRGSAPGSGRPLRGAARSASRRRSRPSPRRTRIEVMLRIDTFCQSVTS